MKRKEAPWKRGRETSALHDERGLDWSSRKFRTPLLSTGRGELLTPPAS